MFLRASYASRPVHAPTIVAAALGVFAVLLAVLLPYSGGVHLFDWDELIFAEAAREMNERGDWLQVYVNYQPFYEKPPAFFWLQALAFRVLGVGELAARLPSAVFTAATGALLFVVGSYALAPGFGLLWALLFGLGLFPGIYGKLGLIDPTFNFFVLLALFALFATDEAKRQERNDPQLPKLTLVPGGYAGIAALALGFAVLVKGPLALAITLTVFALYKLLVPRPALKPAGVALFLAATLAVAGSWFALESLAHGPAFVVEFVRYQLRITGTDDGHPGFVGFHTLLFVVGCFPFSVFAVRGALGRALYRERRLQILALLLFGVVLGLFELVVRTKLIHYSSLLYVPGAFFAARVLWRVWRGNFGLHWGEVVGLAAVALLLAVPLFVLPYFGTHPTELLALLNDPIARSYVALPVPWGLETYLPGALLVGGTLGGLFFSVRGRRPVAVAVLLATGGLLANAIWVVFVARVDAYVSAPQVQFIARVGSAPLAFYGPLTYLPPFYARRAVANPHTPEQLQQLLAREPNLWVVTRAAEAPALPNLAVHERAGAYLLLGPTEKKARRDQPVAATP